MWPLVWALSPPQSRQCCTFPPWGQAATYLRSTIIMAVLGTSVVRVPFLRFVVRHGLAALSKIACASCWSFCRPLHRQNVGESDGQLPELGDLVLGHVVEDGGFGF